MTLSGCGGGGGSNAGGNVPHDPSPPPAPVVRVAPLQYGYYGTWESAQVSETADHVTYVWVMAGDVGIAMMQEAQARGVKGAVVDVGWLVYRQTDIGRNGQAILAPNPEAEANLRAYLTQVRNLGMLPFLSVVYPQDEPELYGLLTDQVTATNALVRKVLAEFGLSLPLAVIYGTNGTPGIASYDIVGKDDYGTGSRVIDAIDNLPLAPTQQKLLVPGGACPWQNDVQPFYDKAVSDPRVWGIAAFIWTDKWGGTTNCGIRSAETRKAYCTVGKHIKGEDAPC